MHLQIVVAAVVRDSIEINRNFNSIVDHIHVVFILLRL